MPKVVRGKTDLWTTSPQIAKLLENHNDGYNLTLESHKKANFKCPYCQTVFSRIVRSINKYGFKCPCCSDGISYPEKFIFNLLTQLNIAFTYDNACEWSNNKRYDFYIQDLSLIIETHGMQHYSDKQMFSTENKRSEKENDKYKKKLAKNNGIQNYVELDCRYSEFEFIKKSILNSELNKIFDLSIVNWEEINIKCLKSKMIEVCDVYNNGIKNISQIAKITKLHNSTVRDYLKKCSELKMCNYSATGNSKKIICVELNKVYDSVSSVKKDGFNISQVSECINGKCDSAGGYNWCLLEKYDPNTYISKPIHIRTARKVLCVELDKIYDKLSDVVLDGFTPSAVSQVCNGKIEKYKNKHFCFI